MHKNLSWRTFFGSPFIFLLGFGLMCPGPVHGGGQFYIIGNPTFSTATMGLSADGSVAVGVSAGVAWRWSVSGGYQELTPQDFQNTFYAAVSADGLTVVSSLVNPESSYNEAARWTSGNGWQFLGGLPEGQSVDAQLSSGWGVNGDGSAVVGLAWLPNGRAEAFLWTEGDAMVGLIGGLPANSSRASKISADGSTIVGFYGGTEGGQSLDRRPTRWVNAGDPDLFLGHVLGEATATTTDGSYIVGGAIPPEALMREAFLYSDATGWNSLGVLDPESDFQQSFANGVSDTGVVVGWSGDPLGFGSPPTGFVWTVDDGMVSAADYLTNHGVTIPSNYSTITTVTCISADGLVLGGQAANSSGFQNIAWVAVLQP
jgi:probable HAF family extracellular repeat protein